MGMLEWTQKVKILVSYVDGQGRDPNTKKHHMIKHPQCWHDGNMSKLIMVTGMVVSLTGLTA